MKRELVSILLCASMAASLITGCGKSGDAGKEESGEKTVSVAIWDNNQLEGLQEIADEWGTEKGVKVEFQVLDWTTYWTMLEAGASGGEMPDVFWMHSANAEKYTNSNCAPS